MFNPRTLADAAAMVFDAPSGVVTVDATVTRMISYFDHPAFNDKDLASLAGGTLGPILALLRLVSELEGRVALLEARVSNDGR